VYQNKVLAYRGAEWKPGDMLGIEVDMDARVAKFFLNKVLQPFAMVNIPPSVKIGVRLFSPFCRCYLFILALLPPSSSPVAWRKCCWLYG
jgi:hypothetical protein